jgi:response regulator of citrate/malate metabolism
MNTGNLLNRGPDKALHILVLEDEAAHVELIRRAFEGSRDTCIVTSADNLDSARSEIARDSPDLIIADHRLPDGKGIDILPRKDPGVGSRFVITVPPGPYRFNEQ